MSSMSDTTSTTTYEKFLTDLKLEHVIPIFAENNATVEEVMELDDCELCEFALDVLKLNVLHRKRFLKAINVRKLSIIQRNNSNMNEEITEEEEEEKEEEEKEEEIGAELVLPAMMTSVLLDQSRLPSTEHGLEVTNHDSNNAEYGAYGICDDGRVSNANELFLSQLKQDNAEGKADIGTKVHDDSGLALMIDKLKHNMRCETFAFGRTLANWDLYLCFHEDCQHPGPHCIDCGVFVHNSENHDFEPGVRHIRAVKTMLAKTRAGEQMTKEVIVIAKSYFASVVIPFVGKRVELRWNDVKDVARIGVPFAVGEILPTVIWGRDFISSAVGFSAAHFALNSLGAGIGAVVVTGCEIAVHAYRCRKGLISGREFRRLACRSAVSGLSAFGGMMLGMTIGAAVGVVGGPAGMVVGLLGGAILGLLCKKGAEKAFDKWGPKKERAEQALILREALHLFGFTEHDIGDLNATVIRRTFRKLALQYHPDRNLEEVEKWHKLCLYYGALLTLCKEGNSSNSSAVNQQIIEELRL